MESQTAEIEIDEELQMTKNALITQESKDRKVGLRLTQAFNLQSQMVKVGTFIWHLAQMILVMEAGMMGYMRLIRPLLTSTPVSWIFSRFPLISYWVMVVSMVLPMLALMRLYHQSTWGYSLGMTLIMVAPTTALTILVVCSLIPIHTLYAWGDPLMYLAMTAYMLFHLKFDSHHMSC
jgi:hypothetical protein